MKCIDQLIGGILPQSRINLNGVHFNFRMAQNRISKNKLLNILLDCEPLDWGNGKKENSYELFYPAPDGKSYGELKVVVFDCPNQVNVATVMPTNESKTNRHKNAELPDRERNLLNKTSRNFRKKCHY